MQNHQLRILRRLQHWRGKNFFDDYYKFIFEAARFEKRLTFFNRGYAHLDADAQYEDVAERFQVEMYRQVALAAGDGALAGTNLLEIASALGGGLSFIARTYRPRLCIGVERSRAAVALARKRFGLVVVEGDARDLRLPDAAFDVAVNIESSNAFFGDAFLSETARVLRPGGRFLFADHRRVPPAEIEAYLRGQFAPFGLELQTIRDISANVARSDELDDDRRELLLARLPKALRGVLRPMFNGITTDNHRNLKTGASTYFIAVFEKQ